MQNLYHNKTRNKINLCNSHKKARIKNKKQKKLKKVSITKSQDQDRKEKEDNQDLILHNQIIKEEINKYLKIEEIERNKKSRKKKRNRKSKGSEGMIDKKVRVLNHMIREIEGIEANIKKVKINLINDVNINP
jgi:hypothetical protein